MSDTIAVTGATGDVGGKTVGMLHPAGADVRAVVRRADQVRAFRDRGIDARLADMDDGETMTAALDGVDQLFLVTAATERQAEHGITAVHAARAAGVRAIVQLSGGDAAEHSPMPWASAIWRIDRAVRASGLERTILHPSGFMTNLVSSGPAIRRGVFPQTMGRGGIGWIDTVDIARVATTVLTAGVHRGEEPVLTGPELLDGRGVAQELTAGLGRPVRYLHLPSRAFGGVLRLTGMPAWQAEGLRQQFGRVARRGLDGVDAVTDEVERMTGTPATPLSAWARAHRAELLGR
ncbi:NmrA family NAD(P)-binding protein [Curtobacterium sp. MCBD17_008]|uniref:NmrA family NAD(P)-binding protein n=1 Tax=Curtobacterium sp. MCBD17_008 TaxID=2175656 RepID=UPI000DA85DAE|nr:NmrA family NAD(P)-binding protein [Curtobacterium sp. MCBD17_008]PZE94511.1 SDR family NAD(P)-dependent oxidoreductase [Curtobacterium sp. MCBD17_008]